MTVPRIIFYCNAIDDRTLAERGITTDSPAATRKVFAIARALQAAGCEVLVVSMARGRGGSRGRFHRALSRHVDGIAIRYGPFTTLRGFSELLSTIWLAWQAVWLVRAHGKPTRHLFYNQFIAYLPALAWLRLAGARTVADIEDGPIDPVVQASLPTRANASPRLFARFISDGALLACRALAEGTVIRPTIPCYGAVRTSLAPPGASGLPLTVLLSGWINEGTGADLLVASLRQLAAVGDGSIDQLRVEVAGFGPGIEKLIAIAAQEPALRLTVHGRLYADDYARLLERASIGLSLKTHASAYADTTFPSKVIEYAERGLCIVSTDISDVRHVFGEVARFVTSDDPALLAAELAWAADHPHEVRRYGAAARALVEQRFTEQVVGSALRDFMFPAAIGG